MVAGTSRTIPLALALLALASAPSIVRAQGAFNPYGNSGYADYREFTVPTTSNNPALPGQARLDNQPIISRSRPNSFRQYTEDSDGDFESNLARRGSSAGVPYTEAYQQLNKQYNRVYKPNDNPKNQEFVDRLKQRDQAFAKALQEKDPVKRSKLLRQLDSEAFDRTASTTKAKAATNKAPDPNPKTRASASSRAPAPSATSSAPPPLGSPSVRRTAPVGSGPPPVPGVTGTRTGGSTTTTTRPAPAPPGTLTPPR